MSPKSEKTNAAKSFPFPKPGDEVVISGIAGRFPESDNLLRFQENLFNKRNLITDDERRWELEDPDIPQQSGKVNNIEKFDSQFFGVHSEEAHAMDPMARMLLEHAYEAIIDAGVNPRQLRGSKTGVFLGSCLSESELELMYGTSQVGVSGVLGCSRGLFANRISNWLGLTGPSYNVDAACGSSMFAMDHAYRAIRSGQCDAALVAGAQLCLHPILAQQFSLLGLISPDGCCKCFDDDADGYCRSEAICVIYLQKAKDAKRIYANVVYTKTNGSGFTEQGITFPSSAMQGVLLQQFYEECGVPPTSLAFVEAHSTGTKAGDPEEVNAFDGVFCPGRTTPLPIGALKSNMGHSEPASGACAIAKVLIAMESGYIPPNLHYNRPRKEIEALVEGRMKVITDLTPWDGGYVGVNSFGFGGTNAHTLLKSNPKEKINDGAPNDDLPRLVVVSGRTEEAVTILLDDLESRPLDVEYVSLFHNIHAEEIPGHLYRGYTILPPRGSQENQYVRDVQYCPGAKQPIWFIFSEIGSPRAGIGKALLKIPVFVKAAQKCDAALKPYNVDIIDILTTENPKIFDNILNSLVGIAVVQIGLVDVLVSIGIVPDNIIGYSIGELGCAYADGCLTAEQTVLAAYFQGLALIETEEIPRSTAVIGSGEENFDLQRPGFLDEEIDCNKSDGSSDFIESSNATKKFAVKLQNDGISGTDELCNSLDYKSYSIRMAAAAPKLLAYLQKLIPHSRPRSEKWRSISALHNKWRTNSVELFSPESYTNNILNPVQIDKISSVIPENATVIEIASRGLLQTVSRRSPDAKAGSIALANCGNEDPFKLLLQAIGTMYELGLHPQLTNLYPEVQYPVSRGTPMISPLVRWNHSEDFFVQRYTTKQKLDSGERVVEITFSDYTFEWMMGHVIDERVLVPPAGYLVLVWETLALMRGKLYDKVSVVFEDVRFHRETTIPKQGSVELTIMVQKGSGRFEVAERDTAVVTGFIRVTTSPTRERVISEMSTGDDEPLELTEKDIYKEFRLRGYHYAGLFRGLKGASSNGMRGSITWQRNWVAFIDNILQLEILGMDTRSLFVPTGIQKLVIDTEEHSILLRAMPDDDKAFLVEAHKDLDIIRSGGVEIRGLKASAIARKKTAADPILEELKFVAHRDRARMGLGEVTRIATHIALENHSGHKIKTIELIDDGTNRSPENLTSTIIQKVSGDFPLVQANVNIFAPPHAFLPDAFSATIRVYRSNELTTETDALLVISHGILANKDWKTLQQLQRVTKDGGFLLAREPLNADADILSTIPSINLDIILEKRTDEELVFLLRKRPKLSEIITVVQINDSEFSWLSSLQAALKAEGKNRSGGSSRILIVSNGDSESGLIGFVNCLRKERGGQIIQGLLIQDPQAPKFSLDNPLYSKQLDLGLVLNILRPGKVWGSYRFFEMDSLPLRPLHRFRLSQLTRGDLSSFKLVEDKIHPKIRQKDIIAVHYSAINFRDVMLCTGKLPAVASMKMRKSDENLFGFEYSGKDVNGRAVMGMICGGAFSDSCIRDNEFLWAVPDNWTLEDAATIPVVYATAYYALVMNGKMKKGDKVLIHAGSGGVGQAAISLALHEGCEVFTTVGTPQKRQFIRDQFPQINDDHIGNSRDTSFEQLILRTTQGKGVNIVLNSLAEDKLQASIRCLNKGGRFLEIGEFDLAANNLLGLEVFLKGISFHSVHLDHLFTTSAEKKTKLAEMLAEGLKGGVVKPLVRTVFTMDQAENAFRYMAAGKHIGKVVLKICNETEAHQFPLPLGLPRYYCSEDCSYLILGGLGGFGLELADWLVLRGAKKLVLTSRNGVTTGYQRYRINIWKSYGVEIVIIVGKDASTHEGCEHILQRAAATGPVDAIFNLAVVIKDGLCENQTVKSFTESCRVKAWATKQLDKLSRSLCPRLRQFVVFSSVSSGRGKGGQTNYGMSNSVMEEICEKRVAENLPGLAVQWGAIGDVGVLVEMQQDGKEIIIEGTLQQKISSCLRELDGFLLQSSPVVSSMVIAEKTAVIDGPRNIVSAVINILELKSLENISQHTPLMELGMDSMMAVEIKHIMEREFGVLLTLGEVRGLNFVELAQISLKQAGEDGSCEGNVTNETDDLKGCHVPT